MKKIIFLLFLFLAFYYSALLSMENNNALCIDKASSNKASDNVQLYSANLETLILSNFLAQSCCEPDIDIVKEIVSQNPSQNFKKALSNCLIKEYWSIAKYILDNHFDNSIDRFSDNCTDHCIILANEKKLVEIVENAVSSGKYRLGRMALDESPHTGEALLFKLELVFIEDTRKGNKSFALSLPYLCTINYLFFEAVSYGGLCLVKYFICNKVVDIKLFANPLHFAVLSRRNRKEMVSFLFESLVKNRVCTWQVDQYGNTPLQHLLMCNKEFDQEDVEIADILLGVEGYCAIEMDVLCIMNEVEKNKINYNKEKILDKILEAQEKAHCKRYVLSNLIWCDKNIELKKIQEFLSQVCELQEFEAQNFASIEYISAIKSAIYNNRLDIVKEIFECFGYDDVMLITSLITYAASKGRAEIVDFLLAKIDADSFDFGRILGIALEQEVLHGHMHALKIVTAKNKSFLAKKSPKIEKNSSSESGWEIELSSEDDYSCGEKELSDKESDYSTDEENFWTDGIFWGGEDYYESNSEKRVLTGQESSPGSDKCDSSSDSEEIYGEWTDGDSDLSDEEKDSDIRNSFDYYFTSINKLRELMFLAISRGQTKVFTYLYKKILSPVCIRKAMLLEVLKYKNKEIIALIAKDLRGNKILEAKEIFKYFICEKKIFDKNDDEILDILLSNHLVYLDESFIAKIKDIKRIQLLKSKRKQKSLREVLFAEKKSKSCSENKKKKKKHVAFEDDQIRVKMLYRLSHGKAVYGECFSN